MLGFSKSPPSNGKMGIMFKELKSEGLSIQRESVFLKKFHQLKIPLYGTILTVGQMLKVDKKCVMLIMKGCAPREEVN